MTTAERAMMAALAEPFPPEMVQWRVGSMTKDGTKGMALAYIDARAVMERLDAVVGAFGWECTYEMVGPTTVCTIRIRRPAKDGDGGDLHRWVEKADGAGQTDVEGEKGALSDAFKRAAVKWGIGRYLYDLPSPWVVVENKRIVASEMRKLYDLLKGPPQAPLVVPPVKDAAAVDDRKSYLLSLVDILRGRPDQTARDKEILASENWDLLLAYYPTHKRWVGRLIEAYASASVQAQFAMETKEFGHDAY